MAETKITHFNKISGVNGVYVKSATAGELQISDGSGNLIGATVIGAAVYKGSAGTATGILLSSAEGVQTVTTGLVAAASAGEAIFAAPYACTIGTPVCVVSASGGSGRVVTLSRGSAGSAIYLTAAFTTQANDYIAISMPLSTGASTAVTAGEVLKLATATCATASIYTVVLPLTKT